MSIGAEGPPRHKMKMVLFLPCLLLVVIPLTAAVAVRAIGEVHDDAFITYRYARNLALGNGLVWNPGEAPTEGFTSLTHVLLLATPLSIGLDGLLAARILNAVFFFGLLGVAFLILTRWLQVGSLAALFSVSVLALAPASINLVFVGMETILFSLMLLSACALTVWIVDSCKDEKIVPKGFLLAGIWFAVGLTRPEGLLIVVAATLAFARRGGNWRGPQLRLLLVAGLVLLAVGSLYLLWKAAYFGSVLPNPFYLKSNSVGLSSLGLRSVLDFIATYAPVLVAAILGVSFVMSGNYFARVSWSPRYVEYSRLVSILLLMLAAFYLQTDTLADMHGRFLYPMFPLLVTLAAPLLAVLWYRVSELRFFWKLVGSCGLLGLLLVVSGYPIHLVRVAFNPHDYSMAYVQEISEVENNGQLNLAKALSNFPDIKAVRIAYGDAGVVPYYSDSLWLDPVGLNDSFLARSTDLEKSVDYFFDTRPDLAIVPIDTDGQPISYGHGLLGDYLAWSDDARWSDFEAVGTIVQESPYSLEFRLRKESRHFENLKQFLPGVIKTLSAR